MQNKRTITFEELIDKVAVMTPADLIPAVEKGIEIMQLEKTICKDDPDLDRMIFCSRLFLSYLNGRHLGLS